MGKLKISRTVYPPKPYLTFKEWIEYIKSGGVKTPAKLES